jgi:hypothetical protein
MEELVSEISRFCWEHVMGLLAMERCGCGTFRSVRRFKVSLVMLDVLVLANSAWVLDSLMAPNLIQSFRG